jgi:hypothetical protein
MFDALAVLLERHEVGHGFFTTIVSADDELEFALPGSTPPVGMMGRLI